MGIATVISTHCMNLVTGWRNWIVVTALNLTFHFTVRKAGTNITWIILAIPVFAEVSGTTALINTRWHFRRHTITKYNFILKS